MGLRRLESHMAGSYNSGTHSHNPKPYTSLPRLSCNPTCLTLMQRMAGLAIDPRSLARDLAHGTPHSHVRAAHAAAGEMGVMHMRANAEWPGSQEDAAHFKKKNWGLSSPCCSAASLSEKGQVLAESA